MRFRNLAILAAITVYAVLLQIPLAMAQWATDPYEYVDVDSNTYSPHEIQPVPDGAGGMLVFYRAPQPGDAGHDVMVQKVNADGSVPWEMPIVLRSSTSPADILEVAAVADGAGGAFVAAVVKYSSTNVRITVQRVNSAGNFAWAGWASPVVASIYYSMGSVSMAQDGVGGVALAWLDGREVLTDDIYAQRFDGAGTRLWGDAGVHVCSFTDLVLANPVVVVDGIGGFCVVWEQYTPGNITERDVRWQHLTTDGTVTWFPAGKVVANSAFADYVEAVVAGGVGGGFICAYFGGMGTEPGAYVRRFDLSGNSDWVYEMDPLQYESDVKMIADGNGGAFLGWKGTATPSDVESWLPYVQSLSANGYPRWNASGVLVGGPEHYPWSEPEIGPDGEGGMYMVWRAGGGVGEIYGQHVDRQGTPLWNPQGRILGALFDARPKGCVADGRGGILYVWSYGSSPENIAANRVERWGHLGDPSPVVTGVNDYPQDQGGTVRLDWTASYLDDFGLAEIEYYSVWRRYAGTAKQAPPGAVDVEGVVEATGMAPGDVAARLDAGWAYVTQTPAAFYREYTSHVPTYGDSTALGPLYTDFQVLAHSSALVFWESNVMRGWSVDNLAPGAPLALFAERIDADVKLFWTRSRVDDEDLAAYRVYRSDTSGFSPDQNTFIGTATDTLFLDPDQTSGPLYYLVTEVDVHDNEGGPSNEIAVGSVSATGGNELRAVFALHGSVPNPFNPQTTIVYELPKQEVVRLRVFDVSGRLVRELVGGKEMPQGRHEAIWNGRDNSGKQMPSGVYFYRLGAGEYSETKRMALIK